MLELLQTLISLIITIGILVTIHEYGHFWVARKCGVRVIRFSIGFGTPIWKRVGADGTEYVVASIPLGGYVKMFGEGNEAVAPEGRHESFLHKSLAQRVAIVAAGPLVNLVFAAIAYAALFGYGVSYPTPTVGSVAPGTLAQAAGLESGMDIVEIDGRQVRTWEDINLALASRVGSFGEITLLATRNEQRIEMSAALDGWRFEFDEISPIRAFGINPWVPPRRAELDVIQQGSAAERAGLSTGDIITQINGQPIALWSEAVDVFRASPGKQIEMQIQRGSGAQSLTVELDAKVINGETIGYFGASVKAPSWPEDKQPLVQLGVVDSVVAGADKMIQMSWLTLTSIGKILTGVVSLDNLSGPITIAKVASASAANGIEPFINFLAFISVSLGVLNLLPIPMLDGGHLAFYLAEWMRGGKPVSERIQAVFMRIGVGIVGVLMVIAIMNDLSRL